MISYNYLLCAGGLPVEALVAAADPPTARNKATSAAMKPFLRDRNWLIRGSLKQYLEGGLLSWDFISEHWPESERVFEKSLDFPAHSTRIGFSPGVWKLE